MKAITMFLCLSVFLMNSVYAQKREEKIDPLKQNILSSLRTKNTFVSDQYSYALVPSLKAISRNASYDLGYQLNHEQGTLMTPYGTQEVVEKKGKFLILNMPVKSFSQLSDLEQSETAPVMLNIQTKQYGILTDHFLIKLKSMDEATQISSEYNLNILRTLPRLNLVVLQTENAGQVLNMFNSLKKDERILRVNLDIIENINVPL